MRTVLPAVSNSHFTTKKQVINLILEFLNKKNLTEDERQAIQNGALYYHLNEKIALIISQACAIKEIELSESKKLTALTLHRIFTEMLELQSANTEALYEKLDAVTIAAKIKNQRKFLQESLKTQALDIRGALAEINSSQEETSLFWQLFDFFLPCESALTALRLLRKFSYYLSEIKSLLSCDNPIKIQLFGTWLTIFTSPHAEIKLSETRTLDLLKEISTVPEPASDLAKFQIQSLFCYLKDLSQSTYPHQQPLEKTFEAHLSQTVKKQQTRFETLTKKMSSLHHSTREEATLDFHFEMMVYEICHRSLAAFIQEKSKKIIRSKTRFKFILRHPQYQKIAAHCDSFKSNPILINKLLCFALFDFCLKLLSSIDKTKKNLRSARYQENLPVIHFFSELLRAADPNLFSQIEGNLNLEGLDELTEQIKAYKRSLIAELPNFSSSYSLESSSSAEATIPSSSSKRPREENDQKDGPAQKIAKLGIFAPQKKEEDVARYFATTPPPSPR